MSENEKMTVELDDPEFSNPIQYDPTQDAGARVTPPELDKQGNVIDYLLKFSVGENPQGVKKPYATVSGKGNKYIGLKVGVQVVAPGSPVDKSFVNYPYGGVTTSIFNGTTGMADLCRALGNTMPANLGAADMAAFTEAFLNSEPTGLGRIGWSGYCSIDKKEIPQLNGEKNWPEKKDEAGNVVGHESVAECPECGGDVEARVTLRRILPKKK